MGERRALESEEEREESELINMILIGIIGILKKFDQKKIDERG